MSNIYYVPNATALIETVKEAAAIAERLREPQPKVVLSLWRGLMVGGRIELTPSEICREVAFAHGFSVEELRGQGRKQKLCFARFEAMWRIYKTGRVSSTWIGRYFGGRDHSTVLHAMKRHEDRLQAEGKAAA